MTREEFDELWSQPGSEFELVRVLRKAVRSLLPSKDDAGGTAPSSEAMRLKRGRDAAEEQLDLVATALGLRDGQTYLPEQLPDLVGRRIDEAVAEEREACARECMRVMGSIAKRLSDSSFLADRGYAIASDCLDRIRARGKVAK